MPNTKVMPFLMPKNMAVPANNMMPLAISKERNALLELMENMTDEEIIDEVRLFLLFSLCGIFLVLIFEWCLFS